MNPLILQSLTMSAPTSLPCHHFAVLCLVAQSCPTLCNPMKCMPGSSVHGDSSGKNSGVSCHALLQGSFQPRDRTQVSRIAGRLFTIWATSEALSLPYFRPFPTQFTEMFSKLVSLSPPFFFNPSPWGFPGGSVVRIRLPVQEMQETWIGSLGQEDPLE